MCIYINAWSAQCLCCMHNIKADHILCIFFINEDLAIISLDNKTRPKNSSNHICIYIHFIYAIGKKIRVCVRKNHDGWKI